MPPPPHGRDLPYDPPLPSGFSKIGSQNLPPSSPEFPKFSHTPLEILLSLIEVNKEVVLFPRMPIFWSFVCILLNCIIDKRIPHANSLCAQVTDKFCAFHVILLYCKWNERSRSKHNCSFLALRQEETNTWRSITSNSWHYSCPHSVCCRAIVFLLVV